MGFTVLITCAQKSFIFSKNKVVFSVIFALFKRVKESVSKGQPFLDSWLLNLDSNKAMGLQCGIVGLPNVGKSTLFIKCKGTSG
jgi:ribosome biogenesis GTPase A